MTIQEYFDSMRLKRQPGIGTNLQLWERFKDSIQFIYKDMYFRDSSNIIRTSDDLKQVIELMDYQAKTNNEAFKILNKKLVGNWGDYLIYEIEDAEINFDEFGWACYTMNDKQILATKDNQVKGFFKLTTNKFCEAPKTAHKLDINGILPDEWSFERLSKEKTEEKYPGLLQTFREIKRNKQEGLSK